MAELSPVEVLQERYRSAADEYPHPEGLAAALEALADQVLPAPSPRDRAAWSTYARIRAIAAELRGGAHG